MHSKDERNLLICWYEYCKDFIQTILCLAKSLLFLASYSSSFVAHKWTVFVFAAISACNAANDWSGKWAAPYPGLCFAKQTHTQRSHARTHAYIRTHSYTFQFPLLNTTTQTVFCRLAENCGFVGTPRCLSHVPKLTSHAGHPFNWFFFCRQLLLGSYWCDSDTLWLHIHVERNKDYRYKILLVPSLCVCCHVTLKNRSGSIILKLIFRQSKCSCWQA